MDEKILYLDCASGISGDMTVGALLDLGASREKLVRALDSLGVSGYHLHFGRTKKCGIDAYDFDVHLEEEEHHHDHEHSHDEHNHSHDEHDHSHDEYDHEHHHDHEHTHDRYLIWIRTSSRYLIFEKTDSDSFCRYAFKTGDK